MQKSKKNPQREWMDKKGITTEVFAHEVGVRYTTAVGWVNAGRKPRDVFIEKIREAYPECPLAQ